MSETADMSRFGAKLCTRPRIEVSVSLSTLVIDDGDLFDSFTRQNRQADFSDLRCNGQLGFVIGTALRLTLSVRVSLGWSGVGIGVKDEASISLLRS